MNNWKKNALQTAESAKTLNLEFVSSQSDLAHHNGPARLIGVVVEANTDFDEEALPAYQIEFASGEKLYAFDNELCSDDDKGLVALINAVSIPFGIARNIGSFCGPDHLLEYGSPEQKDLFQARWIKTLS